MADTAIDNRSPSDIPATRGRSLRAILFTYAFAPALALALVLCLLFTVQQMNERRELLLNHGHASAEQLVELIHLTDGLPFNERIDWLNRSMLALMLEQDMVRSAQLYRADDDGHGGEKFTLVATAGPRPRTSFTAAQLAGKKAHVYEDLQSLQVLHPLKGERTNCWLAIELHRPYFLVGTYQVVLIGLIGLIACALAAFIWAAYLAETAVKSLTRFRHTLRAIGSGDLSARAETSRNLELAQLAREINDMTANLAEYQAESEESLQQSMDDLRQSMDSMEVQNIELELARKKAVENSQVKSTFLANASHEIRTPLNGIIGFTNLLLKTDMDELQRDYLQTIQRSSENLLTTINGILDFSRIETGKLVLDHSPMNLGQVLEETLQILAPYAYEHRLELIPIIDPQLPPSQVGDPLRLKQILTNLVSNAIRSSENGNIPVRIAVTAGQGSELKARVTIADIGNRSDKQTRQELKRLLENKKLQQHQLNSNGMGLSIACRLIEAMHGEIGIDDNGQDGFCYWFQVPLVIDRNRNAIPREQFPGCRVMLADPNPMTRQQVLQQLQSWSAVPQEHSNKHNLLPVLEQMWRHDALPDAVIIDTAMADEDIDGLVADVQQLVDTYQCRVIIQGSPMDLRRCYAPLRTRVLGFVGKPVSRQGLLRALKRAIPHASTSQAVNEPATEALWPHRPRVLVVDDYEANRLLMSELLRAQHIDTVVAASAEEALALRRAHHFDMIFMDIQMPDMDGIEATRRIREQENGQRTPIIALTAHVGTEEKARLLAAGLDDYLSKPVSEAQLGHTVKRWMEIARDNNHGTSNPYLEPRLVDIGESLTLANQDPALACDLLRMLLDGLQDDEHQLHQLMQRNDRQAMFELVHRLHGGCCYCGVPRLRAVTRQLQEQLRDAANTGENDTIEDQGKISPELFGQLIEEINHLRDWAREQDLEALFGLETEIS